MEYLSVGVRIPADTCIEYLTTSDSLGRCRFFLNWTKANGEKKSQVFFANPKIYGFKENDPIPAS